MVNNIDKCIIYQIYVKLPANNNLLKFIQNEE
jgi:hypothetical protein